MSTRKKRIGSDVDITGKIDASDKITGNNGAEIDNGITVNDTDTQLVFDENGLAVTGATDINGNINQSGDNRTAVLQDTTASQLTVTGNTVLNDNLDVKGVVKNTTGNSPVTVDDNLTVTGGLTVQGTLASKSITDNGNSVAITKDINASGRNISVGTATIGTELTAGTNINTPKITGTGTSPNPPLEVVGNTQITGTLDTTSKATLNSLEVTNASNLQDTTVDSLMFDDATLQSKVIVTDNTGKVIADDITLAELHTLDDIDTTSTVQGQLNTLDNNTPRLIIKSAQSPFFTGASDLANYTGTVTNNDYAYVYGQDSTSKQNYLDFYVCSVSGNTKNWGSPKYRIWVMKDSQLKNSWTSASITPDNRNTYIPSELLVKTTIDAEVTRATGIENGLQTNKRDRISDTHTDVKIYSQLADRTESYLGKVTAWSGTTSDDNIPTEKLVKASLDDKLDDTQLVTSWSGTVSDTNIPSEKLVKDNLDTKQPNITGGATSITSADLTPSRALISDANGKVAVLSSVSDVELGYLDGVTSSIQTQLNGKAPTNHKSGYTTYGVADEGNYGHVIVDNAMSLDSTNPVQNKIVMAFINSSIGTATANFLGTYNAVSDLGYSSNQVDMWIDPPYYMGVTTYNTFTTVDDYIGYYVDYNNTHTLVDANNKSSLGIVPGTTKAYTNVTVESDMASTIATELSNEDITPTNNDYLFVAVSYSGTVGVDFYWRFKYDGTTWLYEYSLNNSTFTQAQWDSINSLITNSGSVGIDVQTILTHIGDTVIHVTQGDKDLWDGKQGQITAGTGLTRTGDTINHSNSVTADPTGIGSATAIPIIKYDAQGHITEVTTATVYPPTSVGTSGYVWKSDGDGAGQWSQVTGTSPITVTNTSNTVTTITHDTSGVSAGTYKSVTVDIKGHVTAGSNPTTLAGYGITDAHITSGVITLGSNTITPLVTSQLVTSTDDWSSTVSDSNIPSEKLVKDSLDGKVSDVQINSTSIVSSNIANIPIASSSALGVVKTNYTTSGTDYAVEITGAGNLHVNVPWTDQKVFQEAVSTNVERALMLGYRIGTNPIGDSVNGPLFKCTSITANPSTGVITATGFAGNLTGNVTGNVTGDLTGNVTGDCSGSAGSVDWSNIQNVPYSVSAIFSLTES